MSKRRGKGEGAIFQRNDGIWCATLSRGYDENGKRLRTDVYGKTKRDVQEKLAKLQMDSLTGTLADPDRMTVVNFLRRWLADVVKPGTRLTTYTRYETVVRLYINKHVGGVKLQKLTAVQIQGMLSAIARNGGSANCCLHTYLVLHKALNQAVKWGITQRNACDGVDKPKTSRKTMQVLDREQVGRFLEAAKADRLYAMYLLAVTSGLRQGELFALQWADIDLKKGSVFVQHTLMEVKGKVTLSEPKTASGKRHVMLPPMTVSALKEHRKQMLAEGHPGPWVFCSPEGSPLRKSNVQRRSFKPILKRARVPDIRFHDLRHTAATLLLSQGVHPKVVQERLGHSQISLTLDTYSHVLPSMQEQAANQLQALLSGAS